MQPQTVAAELARYWLSENAIIIDTETTGLDSIDEVIEISLLDCRGTVLMDTLVKPVGRISREAARIHGIQNSDLINAPRWLEVVPDLIKAVRDRTVVMYNASFDTRLIQQSCLRNMLQPFNLHAHCAMKEYAKFWGQWSDKRQGFKWQSLANAAKQQGITVEGDAHRALTDCRTTLAVIKAMASHKPVAA
ncbi:MAG: 3'-5' exonuclease [Marinobacter sp.]|nr:3'-5' exonuclease [Marinobacter sp.]